MSGLFICEASLSCHPVQTADSIVSKEAPRDECGARVAREPPFPAPQAVREENPRGTLCKHSMHANIIQMKWWCRERFAERSPNCTYEQVAALRYVLQPDI
jgi:hypothetical protein